MSEQDADKEFRQIVDAFIHLANERIDLVPRERVSLALMYAAARFCSFTAASHAPDLNQFDADRDTAFEFYTREYQRMLNENLDDYRKIYLGEGKYAHLKTKQ